MSNCDFKQFLILMHIFKLNYFSSPAIEKLNIAKNKINNLVNTIFSKQTI